MREIGKLTFGAFAGEVWYRKQTLYNLTADSKEAQEVGLFTSLLFWQNWVLHLPAERLTALVQRYGFNVKNRFE